ncbi:manganese efflux pump MntP [Lachnotalea sp. AF33-28]|jgi:putative Mn2+ efflux pump MntP|uniref:manganese efflux pump MntP n=1 Tax=Lachnotalea sp. AF33-28 TaxID=2292046 RepID=UPI000E490F8E|nr:manganese efflux pump MntP family protein [Lachnotalea sp. AF33-28]RHP36229.1 manganese efflux pump [Lachnotalea sp. AF33-28]
MGLAELFILAVGLSMDAFAVSICKGLCMRKVTVKKAGIVGLYFGAFQAGMPLLGYALGVQFQDRITALDHWIAFVLLGLIGTNMIREALSKGEEDCVCPTDEKEELGAKNMLLLAVATSIDALAVGVTFAFLKVQIIPAVSFIGIITFSLSAAGVKIGNVFGVRYKSKAELAGGIILILMGTKILLEHLGVF